MSEKNENGKRPRSTRSSRSSQVSHQLSKMSQFERALELLWKAAKKLTEEKERELTEEKERAMKELTEEKERAMKELTEEKERFDTEVMKLEDAMKLKEATLEPLRNRLVVKENALLQAEQLLRRERKLAVLNRENKQKIEGRWDADSKRHAVFVAEERFLEKGTVLFEENADNVFNGEELRGKFADVKFLQGDDRVYLKKPGIGRMSDGYNLFGPLRNGGEAITLVSAGPDRVKEAEPVYYCSNEGILNNVTVTPSCNGSPMEEANVEMYPLVGDDGKVVGLAARTLKVVTGGTKLTSDGAIHLHLPCPETE